MCPWTTKKFDGLTYIHIEEILTSYFTITLVLDIISMIHIASCFSCILKQSMPRTFSSLLPQSHLPTWSMSPISCRGIQHVHYKTLDNIANISPDVFAIRTLLTVCANEQKLMWREYYHFYSNMLTFEVVLNWILP